MAVLNAAPRHDFWIKVGASLGLVVLADLLFFDQFWGSTVGLFVLAWTITAVLLQPAVRRRPAALAAVGAAVVFGLVQVDRPSLLAACLAWIALSTAVLLPRTTGFGDAWAWTQRLAVQLAAGSTALAVDVLKLRKLAPAGMGPRFRAGLVALVLPAVGGGVFLALFAAANPLISETLAALRGPEINVWRVLFWLAVLVFVFAALRPRFRRKLIPTFVDETDRVIPGVTAASVTLSLVVFNAVFALQNGLDLAFLWSEAPLPADMTLAEYAHRGAYPLIVTALLAGLFVLVTLRPGSRTAARPLIRRLVVLWTLQNVLLVASTVLRTLDYVEVYGLTRLRIAALLWMALVAVGLLLICWRMLRGRSAAWLINANAIAAALVLTGASVVDLGAVAAWWNVRHAQEAGGPGRNLDLCYLESLGASALVSVTTLQTRTAPGDFQSRVAAVRTALQENLESRQQHWRGWTWRGARRLERTAEILATKPATSAAVGSCLEPEPSAPAPALP